MNTCMCVYIGMCVSVCVYIGTRAHVCVGICVCRYRYVCMCVKSVNDKMQDEFRYMLYSHV